MLKKVKNMLLDLWYWSTLPAYRRLRTSILFDPDFYLATNPDVAASGVPPLFHYLTTGHKEWREPCLYFHSQYYTKQLLPGDTHDQAPLLHYLTKGWEAGLNPNPFFNHHHYITKIHDVDFSKTNPLVHFLKARRDDAGHSPSPYFDPDFYASQNHETAVLANDIVDCYRHYLETGIAQNKAPSHYFDTAWYLDKTPVLKDQGINPIYHYFMYGLDEKKSPSPLFDPHFYSATYCVGDTVPDIFSHYCDHGMHQDHKPCKWFDPAFYRRTYLKDHQHVQSPLHHFLEEGRKNHLYPNHEVMQLHKKPVISILVPVYNAEIAQLNNCIRSVLYQSYPHWELCLADDCSTGREIRPILEQWARKDDRIKITFLERNSGISIATNSAAAIATGDYIGLLDNDDELSPDALFCNVQAINDSGGELFYSDEDLVGADGRQHNIFRKSAFNSELLLCHNYVTHFVVTKRALFHAVGGCDSRLDGAQDLDLFLKLSELTDKVVHIPKILYHWRASESSTSINHEQKGYANEAGRKSIEHALERRYIPGEAQLTELKYYYRAKRFVSEKLTVTVLINWRNSAENLDSWLSHLLETAGHPIQNLAIVLTNNTVNEAIQHSTPRAGVSISSHHLSQGESFASFCNLMLDTIETDFVAFVTGDGRFKKGGWLQALLEYGQFDETGMVGGRVQNDSNDTREVRPIPDYHNYSPTYYADYLSSCSVLMNGLHCTQEVQSVNIGLCLVQTDLLRRTGAFCAEEFSSLFPVHDLCYRFTELGKRNIYTPYSQLTLKETGSLQGTMAQEQALADEKGKFQHKWHHFLSSGDPFFNTTLLSDKGLSLERHRSWLAGEQ